MEPLMDEDRITLTRVETTLTNVVDQLKELREEVKGFHKDTVSRNEWEQRNLAVDSRVGSLGRELNQFKAEVSSHRSPWYQVVSSITGVVGGLGGLYVLLTLK